MNILNRLRNRSNEQGLTVIETVVGMAITAIVLGITLITTVTSASVTTSMIAHTKGEGQGDVMDATRALYSATVDFHQDYPDLPVSRGTLDEHGYTPSDLPADLVWGVGVESRWTDAASNEVCANAWHPSIQNTKYTSANPAEVSALGQGTGMFAVGCWSNDESGSWSSVAR